jgi:hypothetical protein
MHWLTGRQVCIKANLSLLQNWHWRLATVCFLQRLIQSIGHNFSVFVVCQPQPIITKSIKWPILCILYIYAQNLPFLGIYQDVLLRRSTFLNQWLHMYCRIQSKKYKIQWWKYKNILIHKILPSILTPTYTHPLEQEWHPPTLAPLPNSSVLIPLTMQPTRFWNPHWPPWRMKPVWSIFGIRRLICSQNVISSPDIPPVISLYPLDILSILQAKYDRLRALEEFQFEPLFPASREWNRRHSDGEFRIDTQNLELATIIDNWHPELRIDSQNWVLTSTSQSPHKVML